jgi:hypothetical protein
LSAEDRGRRGITQAYTQQYRPSISTSVPLRVSVSNAWNTTLGSGHSTLDATSLDSYTGSGTAPSGYTVNEHGSTTEHDHTSVDSTWVNGASGSAGNWVYSGKATGTYHGEGHTTNSASSTYSRSASMADTGDVNFDGSTGVSQTDDWDEDVSATQMLGANDHWTVSSGSGTYSDTGVNGWTYSGSSPYTASDATGTVSESGSDDTIVQGTVHSTWSTGNSVGVGAGWQISGGDRTLSTISAGQWTATGTAAYSKSMPEEAIDSFDIDGTNTVTHSQNWSTTDTIKQTLGASANWLTTSHTDNYGSGSLDSTSFSGTGNYTGPFDDPGTATDTSGSLTSQNFNITVNHGASGAIITSGSGTGHQATSDTFGYSEGGASNPDDAYSDSMTYSASGGATTSSVIDTTWKYDPSGSWRAAQTHEVDAGNASNTDNLTRTVVVAQGSAPDQSTVSDHSSYSYSRDLSVTTDPLGNMTISGSDTGAGKASGTFTSSGADNSNNDTYGYTGGGNQTYSNNGPIGAWSGTENETEIEVNQGPPYTWSAITSPPSPGFHGDPHQLADTPLATNSGTWGEEQPSPEPVGTPPGVNVTPDPYWSNVIHFLPGAIADTVSSDASAVWNFIKSPDTIVAAAGFIPVIGNFVAAASDIYHGNYGFAALDIGSIIFDETGAGEAEAEARIVVNIGGDLEKANAAAREGTQVAGDVENVARDASAAGEEAPIVQCSIEGQCFIAGTQIVVATLDSEEDDRAAQSVHWFESTAVAVAPPAVRYITQSIETLKPGDWVLARDQFNPGAPNTLQRIEVAVERTAFSLTAVTIRSSTGWLQTLYTTSEHPLYVPGRGWVVSRELQEGDELVQPDGGVSIVVATRHERHRDGVLVYNFMVAESHTYFVRGENSTAEPVWVHNTGCPGDGLLEEAGMSERAADEVGMKAAEHHIITTYENAGEDAADARDILADAGIDLEDKANKIPLPGHYGPHPPAYHAEVLGQLQESVGDLTPGSDEFREATLSALLDLKNQLSDANNWLTRLITR